MKAVQKQNGSALHIVIIVILVIAVVGLLGFVFWQNFVRTTDTPTTQVSTSEQESTDTTTVNDKTITSLVLDKYNVEIPYDNTNDTYSLTDTTTGVYAGGYTVHSKLATDACGSGVNVGVIKRVATGESLPGPSKFVTIDNYDYYLGIAYGTCASESGFDTLNSAGAAFSTAFESLRKSK